MNEKTKTITKAEAEPKASSRMRESSEPATPVLAQSLELPVSVAQAAGNLAVQSLLRSARLQAKLTVNAPGDVYEQEADRLADAVMRSPESSLPPPPLIGSGQGKFLQRKCACDSTGSGGACEECSQGPVALKRLAGSHVDASHVSPLVHQTLRSHGQPLDRTTRGFMESRLGYDFSRVRVHHEHSAAESAQSLHAAAYTHNQDIVFGHGQYRPGTTEGRRLLAHELVHVVQQTSSQSAVSARLQRAPETATAPATPTPAATTPTPTPDKTAAPALIVDDAVTDLAAGQMRKSAFMSQLEGAVCGAVSGALAGTRWSVAGCPYIAYWLGYYRGQSGQHIDRAIRRFAPEAAGATAAADFIPPIVARVQQSVAIWVATGNVTGVPEGVPVGGAPGGGGGILSGIAEAGVGLVRDIFFKGRDGGVNKPVHPGAIQAQLGRGHALDGGAKSRMESAFGVGFGHVRVHTDTEASQLSSRLNARAFTVGQDIAFGSGEYQPGTLIGDALIAHELAHVTQQSGAPATVSSMSVGETGHSALEEDADNAAVRAVVSTWGKAKGVMSNLAQRAIPSLKSGLRLQRCSTDTCPPGYCWQVVGSHADIAGCLCQWRCREIPTSGPVLRDPNARRPSVTTDVRHGAGGMTANPNNPTVVGACGCIQIAEDGLGMVCPPPGLIRPTSDIRGIAGPIGAAGQGPYRPPQTQDPRTPAAAIAPPPGGGRGGTPPSGPGGGGRPPTPAPTGGAPPAAPTVVTPPPGAAPAGATPAPAGTTPAPAGTTPAPAATAPAAGTPSFSSRGTGEAQIRNTTAGGVNVQINTGHGFNRPHIGPDGVSRDLRNTTLTPDQIETAIIRDISAFRAGGGTLPQPNTPGFAGPADRSITVGGHNIGYRAVQLTPNEVRVGTYFLLP